jgi:PHP family Zn ribbon phosphoesterase
MQVIHEASYSELLKAVKADVAENIILAREGKLGKGAGGGGVYCKIEAK